MGEPKPLARLRGKTLLALALDTIRHARVQEIVVVLGHAADRVREEVPLDGTKVVVNADFATGLSSSIRAGLASADPAARAFLIVLGDQPFVSPSTIDALVAGKATSRRRILIPTFHGTRGNPVLFDRSLAGEVAAIVGDIGCRAIFQSHPDDILEVPVDDPGILIDLDTPEQLVRVRDGLRRGESLESLSRLGLAGTLHPGAHRSAEGSHTGIRARIDVVAAAQELRSRNEPFALATVVQATPPTSGKPGHKALIREDGTLLGWVGGSCAQAAVLAESRAAMDDGRPRLLRLSREAGKSRLPEGVVEYVMECHSGGAMDIYIEPNLPKPQLLIVGDSPIAETLAALGRLMEYRVTVVAPGAERDAYPDADAFVDDLDRLREFAGRDVFVVVATMGKYDEAAVRVLAPSAAYVGLVASRKRGRSVLDALLREGVPASAIERVRTPAGLELDAETPQEIALSIMAEITQVRRGMAPRESARGQERTTEARPARVRDVVCGMDVEFDAPIRATHEGVTYSFCSEGCRSKFLESPDAFLR